MKSMTKFNLTTSLPASSFLLPALLASSLLLTACVGKSDYDFKQAVTAAPAQPPPHGPVFDPAKGKIPTTNDLLFKGSKDGTLNIPNDADKDGKPDNPIIAQINQLDGFSTTNPITVDFGMEVDPATLGDGVKVFQVTKNPKTGAVVLVIRELTEKEIVIVQTADKKLAIVPKLPLAGSSSYMVLLTNAIKDKAGKKAETPAPYFLAKGSAPLTGGNYEALEPLRALINNMEAKAIEFDNTIAKDNIIMSWSFTTQSINDVLEELSTNAKAGAILVVPTGKTTKDIKSALPGYANISIGTLEVPYYLQMPSAANPVAPLTEYWKGIGGSALTRFNKTPIENAKLTIPVMMTTPNSGADIKDPSNGNVVGTVPAMPAGGWPLVIYQHGITRMRTDVLGYADSLSAAGFAVIAIDLPLHGIPKFLDDKQTVPNPFHAGNTQLPKVVEPSFDVDYINNSTKAAGQDGVPDESGTHFMNLKSLLTSRDNIRQGVSNLLVLRRSIENLPNIDASKVGFIAHSLGGIVAVPYLAVEKKSMASSLVASGAGIRNILLESDPFGIEVKAGLKANGIEGEKFDAFMYAAQFILESADPVNYAADAAQTHPIHIIEIAGDKVVVNKTTEALAGLMQAKSVSATTTAISAGKPGIVRFTVGNHSSVLDPTRGGNFLNVYSEIHRQLAAFQLSSGTTINISDSSIIKQ